MGDNVRMGRSEEQARRNERMFREANEQIAGRRLDLSAADGETPFLCECEDETCTEIVRLDLDDYQRVRADDGQFVIAVGHPTRGTPNGLSGDGWVCVVKS